MKDNNNMHYSNQYSNPQFNPYNQSAQYGGVDSYKPIENNDQWKTANIPKEDIEMGNGPLLSTNLQIRLGFIRKVYCILSMQLLLTTFMCMLSIGVKSFAIFQMTNIGLMLVALIFSIVLVIALTCFPSIARTVPTNYILLTLFTLCEGYLVSFVCALTSPKIVLMAVCMTCAVTISLTVYACTTKTDFTVYNGLLFVASCVLMLFGLFLMFTENKMLHIIYCCLGVLIYSIYLIFDTQLIIGNKENELSIDDYIYGALMLYLDIINLFLYILRILKSTSNDD
jgi:FtsH-binding integral membrane protein